MKIIKNSDTVKIILSSGKEIDVDQYSLLESVCLKCLGAIEASEILLFCIDNFLNNQIPKEILIELKNRVENVVNEIKGVNNANRIYSSSN